MISGRKSSPFATNCRRGCARNWCWNGPQNQRFRAGGRGRRSATRGAAQGSLSHELAGMRALATAADDMNSACVARSGALYSTSLQGVFASHSECWTCAHSRGGGAGCGLAGTSVRSASRARACWPCGPFDARACGRIRLAPTWTRGRNGERRQDRRQGFAQPRVQGAGATSPCGDSVQSCHAVAACACNAG